MAALASFLGCSPPIPGGRMATRRAPRRFSCRAAGGKKNLPISRAGKEPEEESREILNAFFLGKAFADAVNERVTSAVGELLSQLGRQQAQQQKEIRQFQEEVEVRARESMSQSAARSRAIERASDERIV
ncbi:uncharacterized protein At4g13200, chloroplastic-like [Selaginella moellendorffii]|uniref:uncharacterized protein At4g13200, chloroplastic-like n=1 Tax=Selaginella moellendorffii TaxID=88036 RepID=UPI000D1C3689|nr:uncharacterized protein At4g13200, chloroplastic-like [Selaginella moellendorffii]|eukprot:XP_024519753.1 uncharacterized protein At4g13200, chloroplastic-like [Selaginella moellendorffii]